MKKENIKMFFCGLFMAVLLVVAEMIGGPREEARQELLLQQQAQSLQEAKDAREAASVRYVIPRH